MEKRTFLKTGLLLGIAAATSSFLESCKTAARPSPGSVLPILPPPKLRRTSPFTLPPLGYDVAALEPHIDKLTMEIHHDRHHNAYVTNLNDAVKETLYAEYELEDIVADIGTTAFSGRPLLRADQTDLPEILHQPLIPHLVHRTNSRNSLPLLLKECLDQAGSGSVSARIRNCSSVAAQTRIIP